MPVTINGTTGIAGVDGSASTPAVQGTDTNTGIFFPAADTIAFAEGGVEAMRIDSSGNVGIGTSSVGTTLDVRGANKTTSSQYGTLNLYSTDAYAIDKGGSITFGGKYASDGSSQTFAGVAGRKENSGDGSWSGYLQFVTGTTPTERARITSGGALLVGTTAQIFGSDFITNISGTRPLALKNTSTAAGDNSEVIWHVATSGDNRFIEFGTEGTYTIRGSIDYNRGGGQVRYNTTSDYRLKENIVDLPNALQTILQLKPRQFSWKETGNTTTGFIAHELQEVFPDCVSGEKDGIDADGNPRYQGVDTSFLVATMTAAIQELKAITDAQATRIETLEAQNAAFEARLAALEAK